MELGCLLCQSELAWLIFKLSHLQGHEAAEQVCFIIAWHKQDTLTLTPNKVRGGASRAKKFNLKL